VADLALVRESGVARLTLTRPPLNVLTSDLIRDLGTAFRALGGDSALRVLVLAGAGRAFSAGVDVQSMRGLDEAGARRLIGDLRATIEALEALPVPTIARLHGHVLGGALELVLACDIRLAAASCWLGMPGLIGGARTTELLLGGQSIAGDEAARWGLVHRAVDDDALDDQVAEWVARFLALPPAALRLQKALLARWRRVDADTAVAQSMDVFARAYATGEPQRAMQAFLDRRRTGG
jgi:enoyl-CoA hydratase/carnithine racemase